MNFQQYDLGHCKRGEIVEVTLSGSAANVRLMDSSNLNSFKRGRRHRYHGGLMKRSPARIAIPSSGRWYVTVDMQGLRGTTRSSVRMLPSALPEMKHTPLSQVPSLLRDPEPDDSPPTSSESASEFDVFLSHASEDKDAIARPLSDALKAGGLSVWFDEVEMKLGDSLRRKIDAGLARSRFGIVILSRSFFSKGWTNYEFDGLVTRAVTGEQIILPIWHEITKQELIDFSPSLADKVARSTSTHTVDEIASEIIELIQGT